MTSFRSSCTVGDKCSIFQVLINTSFNSRDDPYGHSESSAMTQFNFSTLLTVCIYVIVYKNASKNSTKSYPKDKVW